MFLNNVFHKAIVEVTEEETVALATTTVIMKCKSVHLLPKDIIYYPFGVVIFYSPRMAPLFATRVDDPNLL